MTRLLRRQTIQRFRELSMSEFVDASGSRDERPSAVSNRLPSDSFAIYLAKRLIGDKQFSERVPTEAAELCERSHIVLSQAHLALSLSAIIDRRSEPKKRFALSSAELVEVGRACLKYTGTINGTKMPVVIQLYEIGSGPLAHEDRVR